MILLDTHAWIWLRSEPDRLSERARLLAGSESLAVSAISCWEIATLVRLGRVTLDRPVDVWISRAVAEPPATSVVDVSRDIALAAGALDGSFPGDPADRLIFATAVWLRCPLLTKDRRLRAHSPSQTLWE